MNSAIAGKSNWKIFIPIGILAFYGLNADNLLTYWRYNSMIFESITLILIFFAYLIIPPDHLTAESNLRCRPIFAWMAALIFISLVRIMIGFNPDYAGISLKYMLSTLIMTGTWAIAIRYSPAQIVSPLAVLILLAIFMVACGSVIVDPYIDLRARLDPSLVGTYDLSRAGGIYLQPNVASVSLALLYAAILPRVDSRAAIGCTAAVLLAIFLTFSRSGQIVVAFIIALSLMRGYLPRATIGLLGGGAALLLTGSFFQNQIVDMFGISQGSGFIRLTDADRFYGVDAFASDLRTSLAESALADFSTAPWVGQGLGFSWQWGNSQIAGVGTHNLYLRYMLEYGALGALIWPLFLLAAFQIRNRTLDTTWSVGICICGAIAAFFSHNIPEQGSIMVVIIAIFTLPLPQHPRNQRRAK